MNKLLDKAKEIWQKHKIIVIIVAVVLGFGVYSNYQASTGPIDPLDGIEHVAWRIEDGNGYWTYLDSDEDKIATKMRVALLRKMGGQAAIAAVEKNQKWDYDDDDYAPIAKVIGQKKTDQISEEMKNLKDRIKFDNQGNDIVVASIDIPQSEADKDGIKLVKHEYSTKTSDDNN